MRSVEEWLAAYGESHQNPVNKAIHWLCVPVILITLIGVLWEIQLPNSFESQLFGIPTTEFSNLGVALILFAMIYYSILSLPLAMGMLIVSSGSVLAVVALKKVGVLLGVSLLQMSLTLFVVAWIGQFIGHKIEGKKPSFFEDIQFLMIGPLWLLSFVYRRLGINY